MAEERGGVGGWESIARAAEARAADWARALQPHADPEHGERAPEVVAGVRADEAAELLRDFFEQRR
ncbi:hypothetical protein BMH30_05975 [Leucobacter sp. OLES1]|nr:hypothetical protein BMH30_05975 [Leucobacter sp. OLES1]